MQTPDPLKNIDLQRTLRRSGIIRRYRTYQKNYESAKELVRNSIKQPEKQVIKQFSPHFTNEALAEFAAKRIHLVDIREEKFKHTVEQYLASLEEKVLSNLQTPKMFKAFAVKIKDSSLFDDESEVNSAIDLFTPLLTDIAAVAGSEAYKLIHANGAYIVRANMHKTIQAEVEKFATSLLDTDKSRLTTVIENAFNEGASVAEVRSKVAEVFVDIKKYQSERIARTELLRSSNLGQLDAYKQSEVVSGTQWLVDGNPCPECAELDGKIISLDSSWFDQGDSFMSLNFDYGAVDSPPLHPNCECTIVPVLVDTASSTEELHMELAETKEYVSKLEEIIGITDED